MTILNVDSQAPISFKDGQKKIRHRFWLTKNEFKIVKCLALNKQSSYNDISLILGYFFAENFEGVKDNIVLNDEFKYPINDN